MGRIRSKDVSKSAMVTLRLKLTKSLSETPLARDHIRGSCLSQWWRDSIIAALILSSTAPKASRAFSAGACGSLKLTWSLDAANTLDLGPLNHR